MSRRRIEGFRESRNIPRITGPPHAGGPAFPKATRSTFDQKCAVIRGVGAGTLGPKETGLNLREASVNEGPQSHQRKLPR
jgi:hypothetical protein